LRFRCLFCKGKLVYTPFGLVCGKCRALHTVYYESKEVKVDE